MNREMGKNGLFACPCCGYATLEDIAGYDICRICFWEDDGQDDPEENINRGGPNKISLQKGRENFLLYGVSDLKDQKYVSKPASEDIKLRNYQLVNGEVVKQA